MAIADVPLFSMLKTRMQWHQARQKLLSENVANSDLPNFKPRDLRELSFQQALGGPSAVSLISTNPLHIGASSSSASGGDPSGARRFETTPSGNAVNLEDEMMKVAQNQGDFQLATSLYARGLSLLKTAVGKK
ncbi:flagellar basal body rod protein FlgB [Terrarubrum flagellatum]|uniref:flagellar basal body rod protein FlgB n=1 Tax=Terrirubrum flagellatum TaxID=2895980 RepID=UPI0031452F65